MIFKHYRALVKAKEVARFWKIQPPKDYRKTVAAHLQENEKNGAAAS